MRILHAADLVGSGTDADAYLTIARERYRLIRTHEWNDEVIEELQRKFRASRWRIRPSVTTPPAEQRPPTAKPLTSPATMPLTSRAAQPITSPAAKPITSTVAPPRTSRDGAADG